MPYLRMIGIWGNINNNDYPEINNNILINLYYIVLYKSKRKCSCPKVCNKDCNEVSFIWFQFENFSQSTIFCASLWKI